MKDVKAYMARFGLGEPLIACPVTHPPSGPVRPFLTLSPKGLYVVSAGSGKNWVYELSEVETLGLEDSTEGVLLRADPHVFHVAPKNLDQARLVLAMACHLARVGEVRRFPRRNRYVEKMDDAALLRLNECLDEDEVLLVFLACQFPWPKAHGEARTWFLMTNRRKMLLELKADGSGDSLALDKDAFHVSGSFGVRTLRCGDHQWHSTRGNGALFAELAVVSDLPGPFRMTAVACLNWKKGSKKERKIAVFLLEEALERGCHDAALILNMGLAGTAEAQDSSSLGAVLERHRTLREDSGFLVELCRDWRANPEQEHRLLQAGLEHIEGRWILPFYRYVYTRARAAEKDPLAQVERDMIFADFLFQVDGCREAVEILEVAQKQLPVEALFTHAQNQETASPELALKRQLLLLEGKARAEGGAVGRREIRVAAALSPLQLPYLQKLLEENGPDPVLETVCGLLKPGGLASHEDRESDLWMEPEPLSKKDLEHRAQHPMAREGGVWGKLQGMLARAKIPDSSALRQYCERLSDQSTILPVVTQAARFLDMTAPEVFISRGDKAVGMRAFEDKPSFILVGGEHMDAPTSHGLETGAWRFGLAAELAHIKYGHTRATSADVREGVLDKSLAVVGGIVSVIPFLSKAGKLVGGGGRLAGGVASSLKSLSVDKLGKVAGAASTARDWTGKLKRKTRGDVRKNYISTINEELVDAAQVMQLTADRVGLLFSADLKSAIRFMFLSRPDYQTELKMVEEKGLGWLTSQCDHKDQPLFENLLYRIAWLLAFFLSEDYQTQIRPEPTAEDVRPGSH